MPTPTTLLLHLFTVLLLYTAASSSTDRHHRHLLHQPFFPVITTSPPTQPPSFYPESPSPSPQLQPQPHRHQQQQQPPQEKHPFSSATTPNAPPQQMNPFFPSSDSAAAPPPSPASLATFPANISSLLFPHHNNGPKSQHSRRVTKLIVLTSSVISAALLLSLIAFFLLFFKNRRRSSPADDAKSTRSDSLRLFDTAPSDGSHLHKQPPKYTSTNTSSEFLYLGTLVNSRSGGLEQPNAAMSGNAAGVMGIPFPASGSSSSQYQKLGSPELRPLPPLPKYNTFTPKYQSGEQLNPNGDDDGDDNDEFFSPRGSSGRKQSPTRVWSSSRRDFQGIGADHFGSTSFNSRTASYPYSNSCSPTDSMSSTSASPATNPSPRSLKSKSPDSIMNFPAHTQASNPFPSSFSSLSLVFGSKQNSLDRVSIQCHNNHNDGFIKQPSEKMPPPPPPPPPPRFWEIQANSTTAQVKDTPFGPSAAESGNGDRGPKKNEVPGKEETLKPKLKPLHWDKVRASSSRVMVWDQIKASSFQLNEDMIETLFRVNDSNLKTNDSGGRQAVQSLNHENRVLDPKKSQNIAILLRALNVTVDEVCEALLEGTADTVGPELLECLLKMAPTKEEEHRLKEFKDDESPSKLGPAEKFFKALLDIPFAFKRVDAMLYIVNFDSEIEYLKRSTETLEAACGELRNTRMFLKLLEAVLKTGNRMNVGTNRGDAQAFKLDTLLKLIDIKGTDGKTTLLHFVVQEIIKTEGSRLSNGDENPKSEKKVEQTALEDDLELRKIGLQVVSGLSGEMANVKKAAAIDSDVLNNEIIKIAIGITKVKEVAEMKEEIGLKESDKRFSESMNVFLDKAQEEITRMQARWSHVFSMVKEVTVYFHGNSAKEEAHPFRIFMVVRDFLGILDQVWKEVGKINERTVYSSFRPSQVNQNIPQLFPGLNARQNTGGTSDEDEDELLQ